MLELARWDGLDLNQCYAYSDSASDLPMLSAVGHPVAVNPDGKLERHARANGWPVVVFSERTKTVIRRTVAGAASTALAAGTFVAGLELGHAAGGRADRAGSDRARMSASWRDWATSASGRIPDLAVLLEHPVLHEAAAEPASQRPGRRQRRERGR